MNTTASSRRDNIHLAEGTKKLLAGIDKTVSMIRGTYGAAGGNVVLQEFFYPYHSVRNDGKAIVDKIVLADSVENIGANIVKEAGDKADKDSGDGRKTTMILTQAIFEAAQGSKAQPLEIKRSLDECLPIILDSVRSQSKHIGVEEVKSVATIASESEQIGGLISDIYGEIGSEGIIEIENSNLPTTFYEVTEGVRLRNAGYFGAYSTTEAGKAVYKNPLILISKEKVTSVDQLEPIFAMMQRQGKNELVIYCDDIDMSVASLLAYTHLTGGFKTLIIKSPSLWKDWLFEDFAKITGATPIDFKEGKTFASFAYADLGTCDKIVATKDETRIIGTKDISAHVEALKALNTDESKVRVSWLQTKVAVLKVGANSESELSYVAKKAADACHASYLALKSGVVSGGGIALLNASRNLPDTIGGRIMKKALKVPLKTLLNNAGFEVIEKNDKKNKKAIYIGGKDFEGGFGFDVKNGCFKNMVESGIIDPTIVVANAVTNSVSIASTVLTLKGIITSNESPQEMPFMR